ncbi:MAG: YeeE/YedE thiosulfate transporter family protein [Gemmatimonadaceae bacterium]
MTSETKSGGGQVVYAVWGVLFGIVLTKSEVISWFRIQEMFRFQAVHMYGVIGSAVVVAAVALQLIKRSGARSLDGERIVVPPKAMGGGTRYWAGGICFGLGWALVGACPGPLFALLGSGVGVTAVTIVSAVAGTWIYGALRPRLPH